MRWIDQGPEPDGVAGYAQRYTQAGLTIFRTKTENQSEVVPMIVCGPCLDPVGGTVVITTAGTVNADAILKRK